MNQEHVQELQDVVIRFSGDSGDAFLRHLGAHGQRHLDLSRLPRRDSCAAGNRGRSIGLPGPFRRTARHQPRRLLRRTGSDESRGAQSQPPLAQSGSDGHHRRRFAHRNQSAQGRFHDRRSDRGTGTRRSQPRRARHHDHDPRGAQRAGTGQQVGGQVQEHVRAGHLFLPLPPSGGPRQEVPRLEIRTQKPAHRRGQQTGYRRGLQLRSQYPPVRQPMPYRPHRSKRAPTARSTATSPRHGD